MDWGEHGAILRMPDVLSVGRLPCFFCQVPPTGIGVFVGVALHAHTPAPLYRPALCERFLRVLHELRPRAQAELYSHPCPVGFNRL